MYLTREELNKYTGIADDDIDSIALLQAEDDIEMAIGFFHEGCFKPFINVEVLVDCTVTSNQLTINDGNVYEDGYFQFVILVINGTEYEILSRNIGNVITFQDGVTIPEGNYKVIFKSKKVPMERDVIYSSDYGYSKVINTNVKKAVAYQYLAIVNEILVQDNMKKERLQDDNYENEYFKGGSTGVMLDNRVKTLIGNIMITR